MTNASAEEVADLGKSTGLKTGRELRRSEITNVGVMHVCGI